MPRMTRVQKFLTALMAFQAIQVIAACIYLATT